MNVLEAGTYCEPDWDLAKASIEEVNEEAKKIKVEKDDDYWKDLGDFVW